MRICILRQKFAESNFFTKFGPSSLSSFCKDFWHIMGREQTSPTIGVKFFSAEHLFCRMKKFRFLMIFCILSEFVSEKFPGLFGLFSYPFQSPAAVSHLPVERSIKKKKNTKTSFLLNKASVLSYLTNCCSHLHLANTT